MNERMNVASPSDFQENIWTNFMEDENGRTRILVDVHAEKRGGWHLWRERERERERERAVHPLFAQ